jgi:hypothetical protein
MSYNNDDERVRKLDYIIRQNRKQMDDIMDKSYDDLVQYYVDGFKLEMARYEMYNKIGDAFNAYVHFRMPESINEQLKILRDKRKNPVTDYLIDLTTKIAQVWIWSGMIIHSVTSSSYC